MKRTLVYNSLFGLGQSVINLVLVFFTVPLFIKLLGTESYGIFALIMGAGSLNTLTNLGLNNALIKFIAEQGQTKESNTDILVAVVLIFTLITPVTIIALYFHNFILSEVLKVPYSKFYLAKEFYIWVILANAILLVGQIFKAVLDGLQKIYLTSLQQLIYNILYWGGILGVLLLGYDLPAIGLAIFVAAFAWLLITVISTLRVWGKISFKGFLSDYQSSAKKQLNYGLKIYSGGLISFFYEPLSKILISNFIGVSVVGFYDIALRIKGQLWGFILKIFYPLLPFISEQKDEALIREYIHDIEQKAFLAVLPIVVIVIFLLHPFITLWIGKNIDIISVTAIFIVSFHLISSTVIPNYQFLLAKNLPQKTIIIQLSNAIFNVIFFFMSISFIGYYAIIVGNVAAIISSFTLSLFYQKKYLNSLIFDSLSQLLKFILSFIILLLFGYVIKLILKGHIMAMIIILPIVILFLALFLYQAFNLLKQRDIYRYFGTSNKLSFILCKFFYN